MRITVRMVAFLALGLFAYIFWMAGLVILSMEVLLPPLALTDGQTTVAVWMVIVFSVLSGGLLLSYFFMKPLTFILSIIGRLSAGNYDLADLNRVINRRGGKPKLSYFLYREVIADLRTLSANLEQAAKDRENLEGAKRDWVSGVSHDLKTPLSYVMGYAGLLLQDCEDKPVPEEDRRRYLGEIYDKSNYIKDLIGDMNLLYRQDTGGEMPLQPEELDLVGFLRELIIDVANDPRAADYPLSFDAEEERIPLKGDRKLLYRAFLNVLMNAVNHNPPGTEINVSIGKTKDKIMVEITDNGNGMEAEVRESLFNRYYRGPKQQERDDAGGLGLLVVKNIVEAHNGSISVESEPGAGSKFTLLFPCR